MIRRHYVLGAGAALATSLLAGLATPALAQRGDDDGEFVILQARYGTDRNHVDVTDRLRQMARRDRRVRLTNDLFGGVERDHRQTRGERFDANHVSAKPGAQATA